MNDLIEQATLLMMTDRAQDQSILAGIELIPEAIANAMAMQPIEEDTPLFI